MTLNQTTGPSLREQLIVSAHRWLSTMNDFTPDAMVSHRTEECVTRPAPRSLGFAPLNNGQLRAFFKTLTAQMKNFNLALMPGAVPIVDERLRMVVMHLASYAEAACGLYENEYMVVLTFNEEGTLLRDVIEFADSDYCVKFAERQAAAAESTSI